MRWATNLALQFLLIASSNSDFVSPSNLDESMASYTQLHQKKGAAAVKFHISCADCGFEQRTGRPLELGIYVADQACDRTVLVLNGRKLTQAWNDSYGYGSRIEPVTY
ncbi:hypothetical protein RU639_004882 [Aspergillus parasiticus]